MRIAPVFLFFAVVTFCVACLQQAAPVAVSGDGASAPPPQVFNLSWAKNAHWYDGLAEVAVYDAERVIYGKVRSFEYTFATVKEDHNRAFQVKTDDYNRSDLFGVMKVNQFARIPTENYPYHFLTSVFFPDNNPYQPYKLTQSSQEWCGQTFKAFYRQPDGVQFDWNSYWDGQGAGKTKISGDFVFEDQLPYTLRTLKFEEGLAFNLLVRPTEATAKALNPDPVAARFEVSSTGFTFDSKTLDAWKVTMQAAEGVSVFVFEKTYPNALLLWEAPDGRKLRLKSIRRWAYWVS